MPNDREFINSRIFPVSREVLFNAWMDPKLLAEWWGPKGFTNTFHTFDPRPGGMWEFTMHGPGGKDYPNKSRFEEITPPSRIVFRHLETIHAFQVTATFEAQGENKTKLTFRMVFDTVEEYEKVKHFVPQANEQNFDRLEEVLKIRSHAE